MMVGIDVVDVERLRTLLTDRPEMHERLFTEAELTFCSGKADPVRHLAGTLAAKEAVIKAHRLGTLAGWSRRIVIERTSDGAPHARLADHPGTTPQISISHDGGVAVAVAIAARTNAGYGDHDELGPWLDRAS